MQFTKEELDAMLEKHGKWLDGKEGGKRIELCGANLSDAELGGADLGGAILIDVDLRDAILIDADLRGAILTGAYLRGAILHGANLNGADLSGVILHGANLSGADLTYSYLSGVDLSCTILSDANLSGVKGLPPICCPEEGSFIGWKKCISSLSFNLVRIVKLLIPEDAKRSSATGRKCRCDKALVLGFYDLEGNRLSDDLPVFSSYDPTFYYCVGETVSVSDFDENRWNECAPGIHFFVTRQEAIDYMS